MDRSFALPIALALIVGFAAAGPDKPDTAAPVMPEKPEVKEEPKPEVETMGNGSANTVLERESDGHFYANVMVNGSPIRFLVDTGASSVALSRRDAQAAGLQFSDNEFTGRGSAASGEVAFKPILLDRVGIGPLEATDVEAVVLEGDVDISLLGQSWLRRIGSVTIEGDKMVLR
jgi:aspartyl protease family protein